MGCATSCEESSLSNALVQAAKIDEQLRADKKTDERTIKILLLGAGESGKSTVIKQMRIIHGIGFQDNERRAFKSVIYSNVVIAFRVLLNVMNNRNIDFVDDKNNVHAELLRAIDPDSTANKAFKNDNVKEAMLGIWQDPGVQKTINKGHEHALNDNLNYYFKNIEHMFDPAWTPDDQDMLHARLRTTGIAETVFEMGPLSFRMIDVGGQRSERKKWIHCFEGVQCLLFIVALSGYDQPLLEDENANQMHEAMMLFESLVNSLWFKQKPIILFLNKIDLLSEKLTRSPVSQHFPDYKGDDKNEQQVKQFFSDQFRAINRTADREIYIHFTNARDTTLLRNTMESVQGMLIQKNLKKLLL